MDETAAAIDIGSNTVHMLMGRVREGRVDPLDEGSILVGLAEDVYGGGAISPERMEKAVSAVAELAERVRARGASSIVLYATAAVRDAANADDLAAAIEERAGLEMRAISGEREAELTYRGASAGEEAPSLQVCDVGGGSTEVIRAEQDRVVLQQSLSIGSSRLSRDFKADPPSADELSAAEGAARHVLEALPDWRPARLLVTGGTATALAHVAGATGRRYVMSADELSRLRTLLAQRSSADIADDYGVEAKRARLLPAGATIIEVLRAAAQADEIVLTAAGLRDGMLIEYVESRI